MDNHTESFNQDEMSEFFSLFWPNISIICGAGAEEDLNKQLTDSLNNYAKVSVNDEYKVFDEEVLPHVIEKMNFDFEINKPISEELLYISVIDVYEANETENNEEEKEKKGKDIPAYLQFILIFFALCKSKALTEKVVLNQLLNKCNFSFTDEIIENFISCCGNKVFLKKSLKFFFSKFHDKCKLNKEQWKQLMQCSDDNAFSSEILEKFFIDIEKNKIGIDLIEELLRCSDKNSFNEKILSCFLIKCDAKILNLNAMKNLIKCCPNEIFKNHFSEILDKCPAEVFDNKFVSEVLKIKDIIFSEEIALKFLKCCDKEVFDNNCFDSFKINCDNCELKFAEEIILGLIRVSDNKIIKCKLEGIKTKFKEKSLNKNILKAVLCKFENGEISSDLLDKFLKCFPVEVIQNNLINILEKCAKKVLNERNLKKLLNKLFVGKSSEESVIWLFSNFPDEVIKNYSNIILQKLKGTSSNEKFLNLVLEKGDMSSNLPNLLFEKFDKDLLKKRLVDILRECSDDRLLKKNCDQILNYFEKGKLPNEVANEIVRCVSSIDWIFDNLYKFWDIESNEEFLKAILGKFKSQSRVITSEKFYMLLENFDNEIIQNNLIDILQNLDKKEEYLSGDVLNKVLDLYQLPDKMSVELSNFLFENFAEKTIKEKLLNILSKCKDDILNKEISNKILDMFGDEKISNELAKKLIRCCDGKIFDSALINKFAEDFSFDEVTINKFLNGCAEDFYFNESTTEKFYKCFEEQSVTGDILVKLLNRGFQFDVKVCKEDNFQIFDLDIFTSKNYKDLRKNLKDKSAVKNLAALYNSYNKSNIKIGYGTAIGIGLLILLIAVGLSVATFGLGALAISPVAAIATIAVTATVGLVVTSVFSSFMHLLRLNLAKIIKNFIKQKYQDSPIDIEKEMKEKIAPDMRFWLGKRTNEKDETKKPLLTEYENEL